ncbi:thioredoxin domain-containing protein [Hyphomicrobium methylovorum]|uniref:thioredoxin domain-containing protein n=1 Tax=Hyphomicrobium methylovorum TaxID=84 RepID=UPI0015E7C587|nr:thioredoxin domain-containing protein [Hyphomicrobium methylovorum]MBA2126138.1 thioredoxin domain-containing protein [Hyphomicrobium methylovorum]
MSENRLQYETSPYLLQHKDNPVHWWAWEPDALAEAKRTGKPILLSVGYAACHWCHVMAHESFEDVGTANVMNELFVNIKVDREERPDIDAIYMGALHRLGEQGGWPLTMFLDSDARPFWGGTYFPRESAYGRPAFVAVLLRIAEAFQSQPENVRKNAEALIASLRADGHESDGENTSAKPSMKDVAAALVRATDITRGGLSGAPKFPQRSIFWLLWRAGIRFDDESARHAVIITLRNICQGGIYDHLGGGFARYSVDENWLVPHFEKMLYDNALLIDLLTEVWRETQEPLFAARVAETVAWLEREMIGESGGFASSLDADSEGEEGKFYVWSASEIADVLGSEDAAFFARTYGVTPEGNFEGATILNRLDQMARLSHEEEAHLATLRAKLLERRGQRIRPGWDDKILADWNGLMIAALARAAIVFDEPNWLKVAERAFEAIVTKLAATKDASRLFHAYRANLAKAPATASDFANMTWAALRLFEATGSETYLAHAKAWTRTLDAHYWDESAGGYFTSADDTTDLIVRMKSANDDATPNANPIQLSNLLALATITGDAAYEKRAREIQKAFAPSVARAPIGHCGLLAAELDLDGMVQVGICLAKDDALANVLKTISLPGALEFVSRGDLAETGSPLSGKTPIDGKSTAYVCVGPVCGLPIQTNAALAERLRQVRTGTPMEA